MARPLASQQADSQAQANPTDPSVVVRKEEHNHARTQLETLVIPETDLEFGPELSDFEGSPSPSLAGSELSA